MKLNYLVLCKCPMFAGINEADIKKLLECLHVVQKRYKKNRFIFSAGDKIETIGIVLKGAVHIVREDYWGKRKILARIESGGLFGEALAFGNVDKFPVSVIAAEESEIMLMNCRRIIISCHCACVFHTKLIKNLMVLLAQKNITLIQKLEHITQNTTREKLLSYLDEQACRFGKKTKTGVEFTIPFNREELADYLSVDRSAMSAELSKMRNDGLIIYRKNHFQLFENASRYIFMHHQPSA